MSRIQTTNAPLRVIPLVCLLAVCAVQSRAQRTEDVTVSYSLDSSQFTLHEPMILEFVVKNSSGQPIQLDLGNDLKESFFFSITTPDGKRVPLPQLYREGFRRVGRFLVDPGREYKQGLLLNEWYDFGVEGKYEVEVRLTQPVKTAGETWSRK